MGFKEEYEKFGQPSPAREAFVLKNLLSLPKDLIVGSMRPITVPGPNNTKLTYKVMPDYIMIDGMRVPMSGNTAQQVADHFGLKLPSAKMADDIYHSADVKVTAEPLSGTGVTIDGKHYSNTDVTSKGVGYAPFAVAYNEKINKQLKDKGFNPNGNQIVSGFAKDIVTPPNSGKLGLYGLFDNEGHPIQGGSGQTPHDTTIHTEYCSFARLVSPDVIVTYPDGTTDHKQVNEVYKQNQYVPGAHPTQTSKPNQIVPTHPMGEASDPELAPIDNLLQEFSSAAKTRMKLLEKISNFSDPLLKKK